MSDHVVYVEPDEMTLRDYARVIQRRKWFVIIPAVLVTGIALAMSLAQTEMYRATTDVLVKQPPSAGQVDAPLQTMDDRELRNELQRAEGSAMQDQVRELIGDEPNIDVRLAATDDTDVFEFTGESRDAQLAVDAADAYADTYIAARRASLTSDLEARITVVQQRVDQILATSTEGMDDLAVLDLANRLDQYQFELESLQTSVLLAQESGAQVIDAAQLPEAPFEPTPMRTGVLALVVGLLLGLGAAFTADYLDQSVHDEDDLAKASGLPTLAVIPKLKGWEKADTHVITREDPTSAPAEAYRALRTAVQFLGIDRRMRTIQVTSPTPGDGKSTTSTNLAVASARAGQNVLLVDCDLRRPRVHHFFSLSNDRGFTTVMVGGTHDEVVQKVDGEPNLSVITSGPVPPDPSELLSTTTARTFLASLADQYDMVIIDSPPVLMVADPLVVSSSADGVILVASAEKTDRSEVQRASEQLAQIEAPAIGTVLNAVDIESGAYHYRYRYGTYEPVNT